MRDADCDPRDREQTLVNEGDDKVNRDEAAAKLRKSVALIALAVVTMAVVLGVTVDAAFAQGTDGGEGDGDSGEQVKVLAYKGTIVICIGILVGAGSIAAAYAVAKVGSAALGAVTERPEMMGRALIFVALAEGIAIYGLLMAILLLRQLG